MLYTRCPCDAQVLSHHTSRSSTRTTEQSVSSAIQPIEATRGEDHRLREGRSTTEQIFSLRILCEKDIQQEQDLYQVFIDSKKTFNRDCHAALWATMKKYNISTNLIQVIKDISNRATSTVLFISSGGVWLGTTFLVRQRRLLSLTLFNIFMERIMTDTLEDREGTVGIGGRTIKNLRFADDIDGLAGEEQELANLVQRPNKASTAYDIEFSAEKTKLMANNTSGINIQIKVDGQKLGTVTSF